MGTPTAAELRTASEAASNLAKQYRSVLMIADKLADIADLSDLEAAITKRIDALAEQEQNALVSRDAALAAVASAEAGLAPAQALAAKTISDANAQVGDILAQARADATALKAANDAAIAEAYALLDQAQAEAARAVELKQAELEEATNEKRRIQEIIDDAQARILNVDAQPSE